MKKRLTIIFLAAFLLLWSGSSQAEAEKLNIGVTLHPYYSWVKNIVNERAPVTSIIPFDADPHSYLPRPEDLKKLQSLSVIVINGLGHDEFIKPMLKAAGREDIRKIDPHKGLPLIPIFTKTYKWEKEKPTGKSKVAYNSHTFISITSTITQIYTIANELGKLDPGNSDFYRENARSYSKRLRRMLGFAIEKINAVDASGLRIATVHDGYAYLMGELGLKIEAVIQPRHGINPNPRQLQDTINAIKKAGVNILFVEMDYSRKFVNIILKETGCRVYQLSHISVGPYKTELFEEKTRENLDAITKALTDGK